MFLFCVTTQILIYTYLSELYVYMCVYKNKRRKGSCGKVFFFQKYYTESRKTTYVRYKVTRQKYEYQVEDTNFQKIYVTLENFSLQLLVSGGQPTTATSPAISGDALSSGALSPSSTATTTGVGPPGNGGTTTPVGGITGPNCCENGRPVMTDPVTGQTVCSCQYDSAARLALGAYPRLAPAATTYSSYPTPTSSTTDQGPYPSIGMDSSAFYSPLVSESLLL